MKQILIALACSTALAFPALAVDYAEVLSPAKPGLPLAHPVIMQKAADLPFTSPDEGMVNPAYVPGLPGLPQGYTLADDFGRAPVKHDGVFIRQSRVEGDEVVIPTGGLVYMEDTWGGEVALRGEQLPVLGRKPVYIDYDMSIAVQENVTLPAGKSVAVGGTAYSYSATVGHETLANHTLQTGTIGGTDWDWAFGGPVLSDTETGWYGMRFAELYNQGQARSVSREAITFDWLSGVRMDRLLLAENTVFKGLAGAGQSWQLGGRELVVKAVDEAAGNVTLELRQDGKAVAEKTLGPVVGDRLIEDTAARKALIFEHGDVVAFLSPWPEPFQDGKASLKVYDGAFSLAFGADYAADPRFAVYPLGCPTGHNFGFMLVNKQEIRIPAGGKAEGPEGYFRITVNGIANGSVTDWHVEDRQGNRSLNLGGAGVGTIDLVLGQGRAAGQSMLKSLGRGLLARTYDAALRAEIAALPEGAQAAAPLPAPAATTAQVLPATGGTGALYLAIGLGVLAAGAFGFEIGRRRA